jgi:hypothetical protein
VATEPLDDGERRAAIAEFCREIETYLCRKNDGHLIRVTGPSFDLVAEWAARGVPLKVAFKGIDRYFERYYAKGPRRRPVKIDFCEADVLDVFDEWKRATGVVRTDESQIPSHESQIANPESRRVSLPAHLERVVTRLTSARASGVIGESFDVLIDRASRELETARSDSRGLRGAARRAMIDRLTTLDGELLARAHQRLDEAMREALAAEADDELRPFRAGMPADAFARARQAALDRLVRERFRLPVVTFS